MITFERLTDVMLSLYASEINCGMESFWDGGFTVWVGDQTNEGMVNGVIAKETFDADQLDSKAVSWLAETAAKVFPDSDFAQQVETVDG